MDAACPTILAQLNPATFTPLSDWAVLRDEWTIG
jgi:hypothetical protein